MLVDPSFLDKAVSFDLLRIDLLLGLDPRGIGFAATLGLFAGDFRSLRGAADFYLTLLLEARIFLVATDLEAP